MHVCATRACNAHTGQKRVYDPLELEFRRLVSHHATMLGWEQTACPLREAGALKSTEPFLPPTETFLKTTLGIILILCI